MPVWRREHNKEKAREYFALASAVPRRDCEVKRTLRQHLSPSLSLSLSLSISRKVMKPRPPAQAAKPTQLAIKDELDTSDACNMEAYGYVLNVLLEDADQEVAHMCADIHICTAVSTAIIKVSRGAG